MKLELVPIQRFPYTDNEHDTRHTRSESHAGEDDVNGERDEPEGRRVVTCAELD